NHNYAVDPESLPDGVEVTHVNLNDGSCAVSVTYIFHMKQSQAYHMILDMISQEPRTYFFTTSKHLAEIMGKFDRNITRRGLVRKISTNKVNNYCVGAVMIGFYVFSII
ncbi:carbamoyl-phosphate synthase small chain, chloroplastic, partial [Tanacetum coccineum]